MTGIASSNRFLYVLVFVVGISTLGAEIAAARLMAPFFGASTIVWANTIGVVLVALSIGYWLGGRLGDRYPSVRSLCLAVMAAALMLALVPLVSQPFFDLSVDALDEIEAGAFIGSLFAVLVLIAVPVGLAGTCSLRPYGRSRLMIRASSCAARQSRNRVPPRAVPISSTVRGARSATRRTSSVISWRS